jgi:CRP/FNR family transcriptional regulator
MFEDSLESSSALRDRDEERLSPRGAWMREAMEAVLRSAPLFASLTEKELQALALRATRRQFERGELLFGEGDPCTGLFVVTSGKIRIFKVSPSGREQVLAIEGPGSSFAELLVFDGGNYPAAASASEDAEVLFVSRKDFQNFCRDHPEAALKIIAVMGARLRRLVRIIEDLSFTTVRHRLIALILRLAQVSGSPSEDRVRLELTMSHQDLAGELGTVRELVSRNLSRLQAQGFLEVDGRKITVKDLGVYSASKPLSNSPVACSCSPDSDFDHCAVATGPSQSRL